VEIILDQVWTCNLSPHGNAQAAAILLYFLYLIDSFVLFIVINEETDSECRNNWRGRCNSFWHSPRLSIAWHRTISYTMRTSFQLYRLKSDIT
jgi:hypothetical protein